MEVISAASTFLFQNFQEFYRELLIQKEKALRSLEPQEEETEAEQKVEFENLVDKIQRKFHEMFERFSLVAQNQVGEFAVSHFQEALYIMVALTDEVFLSFAWPGQKRWEDHLLEAQIFHTQIAGELFFKKLDALIEVNDPVRNDLAVIYLMALALGFKGRYRDENDAGKIQWYRQQLYLMVNRRSPILYHPGREHLLPDIYEHNLSLPFGRGLPDLRTWLVAFGSIITVFVFISSILWYKLVHDVDDVVGQILTQAQKLGLS
jgi:type VI secretion system protein ImpK